MAASSSLLPLWGALYDTASDLESQIQATHQFTIDSHKPQEALQEILRNHQTAMAVIAASAAFYRNICLGSMVVTVISGFASSRAKSETAPIFATIGFIAAVVAIGSGIMWWLRSSTCTKHQTWALSYSRLIEVKYPPAPAR
ncbi:MAG: hypothetical protein H7A38_05115 [Chlamydiales bacterium]|nr:hypothetical protein [Chlamydiales bacterium]